MRAGNVYVAGLAVSEVAEMEIFCLRCVFGMLAESRRAWKESRDESKALREMLSILPENVKRYVAQPPNPNPSSETLNPLRETPNPSIETPKPLSETSELAEPITSHPRRRTGGGAWWLKFKCTRKCILC